MGGSAIGGLARFWLSAGVTYLTGPRLPWGTLLINVAGSMLIGWFAAATGSGGRLSVPPEARLFVMVGLCGGFTTFSSFSLQAFDLLQAGETGWALAYIAGSVALCMAGVTAGVLLGR